jgi:hypothetical protein
LVNTAAEAMDTPVTAANTALAPTVAMPRPPRTRRSRCCATSKVSLPTFEMLTSRPISTKSGMVANR